MLTDNLGLKALSALLGFTLWYAVGRDQGAEFSFAIPIELRDVPEGLEVIEESAHQVDVRLRGPAEMLRGLTPQDVSVAVDLSDAEPGQRVAYLTPEEVTVPFGARVMRVTPSSLQIELDRTLERTVNVLPRVSGAPAPGFELAGIGLLPPEITIVGPESRIRGLDQVTTELVSAEGLRQPFSRTVRLELDPLVRLARDTSVELTLNISEERIEKVIADVEVNSQPPGVQVELQPDLVQVLVEGPKSLVDALGVEDLAAELRVDGIATGLHRLVPIVRVLGPDEMGTIRIVSVDPEEIEVRVR